MQLLSFSQLLCGTLCCISMEWQVGSGSRKTNSHSLPTTCHHYGMRVCAYARVHKYSTTALCVRVRVRMRDTRMHSVRCRSTAAWPSVSGLVPALSFPDPPCVFLTRPSLCGCALCFAPNFPPSLRTRGCGRAFGGALGSTYLCEGVSLFVGWVSRRIP